MKRILLTFCFACIALLQIHAQDSAKSTIKTVLDARRYEFEPDQMTSTKGKSRHLTPGYILQLKGDTLMVYLPYVGRAYSAPMNSSDAGFDFTTTNFSYTVKEGKKKSYIVTIKTKDKVYNTEFTLTVYDDGTTYVRTNSNDRDAVSYNGDIKEIK